jgi:hypothetical protein
MDNVIRRLYEMTETMAGELEDADYTKLEQFVAERELVLNELKAQYARQQPAPHQRKMIEQVLTWDRMIMGRMEQLKSEASKGLRRLNDNRKQHEAYAPVYSIDGVYFDKRK